jgi:pimeloyl-ACP methyl ester carboxylesterase
VQSIATEGRAMTETEAAPPTQTFRPGRRLVVAAVPTTLAALAVPASAASAHPRGHHPPHGRDLPTVVLVHGAWADGSGWSGVVERLLRAGYPVRVPPNPLRSLAGDAATIADFLATLEGPVVLVGHSYGGAVISNAATGNENVKALVYVDAFAPEEGETIFPLVGADSALAGDPATLFDPVPYPGAPAGDVDLYLQQQVFLTSFANLVDPAEAAVLYTTQRPIAFSAGNEPSGPPAWRTIPSWYLLGTRDLIITPTAQASMAERAGATVVPVRAGHLSLVSAPSAVARLIGQAARATA